MRSLLTIPFLEEDIDDIRAAILRIPAENRPGKLGNPREHLVEVIQLIPATQVEPP